LQADEEDQRRQTAPVAGVHLVDGVSRLAPQAEGDDGDDDGEHGAHEGADLVGIDRSPGSCRSLECP